MSKFAVFSYFCILTTFVIVTEAIPTPDHNKVPSYFHYTAVPDSPKYNTRLSKSTRSANPDYMPYQKYLACVPRTFIFEECTLCFCTDMTNVAVCWDYDSDKCTLTQRLVEEQNKVVNNDPTGIW